MKTHIKPINNFAYNLAKYRNICSKILEEIQWLYSDLITLSVTTYDESFNFTNYSANIALDYNLISSGAWIHDKTTNWKRPFETLLWCNLENSIVNIKLPPNNNYAGESHMFSDKNYGWWVIHLITRPSNTNPQRFEYCLAKEFGIYLFKNLRIF